VRKLKPSQLKVLSEFFNTVAAAWFSAGIISPFFVKSESLLNTIILGTVAIMLSMSSLGGAVFLVRRIKL